jgi:hypothetical protein
MSDTHALRRTSPKGGPFFGTCFKCGVENLPVTAVGKPCSNPANLSQDEALLVAVKAQTPRRPHDQRTEGSHER